MRVFATLCLVLLVAPARADEVATAVYVRSDSDHTTVVSPRAHVQKQIAEATQVDVTYAADVWSSASIDIRAAASKRVIEQRDELDMGASHKTGDLTLNGGYRFSTENDYTSHGLNAGISYDFARNSATLAAASYLFLDSVGRSGDPTFDKAVTTAGSRLSFTQVIDPASLVQIVDEPAFISGYQASPYRFIGVGGTGFGCLQSIACLPEHTPDSRFRNAVAIQARRALGDAFSLGATYRFYLDTWSLSSHTLLAQAAWLANDALTITLQYRFYTQGEVDFYRARYASVAPNEFTTRDRELSPMGYQRVALELDQLIDLFDGTATLHLVSSVGGTFYHYDDFVGLRDSRALELTLAATLER